MEGVGGLTVGAVFRRPWTTRIGDALLPAAVGAIKVSPCPR